MNSLITNMYFMKLRDQGAFSKKIEGKHSYFLYLEPEKEKKKQKEKLKIYVYEECESPPPAPRYRTYNSKFKGKYFNNKNIPNRYSINQL